jgi:hypothetical protein
MEYFTHEEKRPSELSLRLIRQFAYAYNSIQLGTEEGRYVFN